MVTPTAPWDLPHDDCDSCVRSAVEWWKTELAYEREPGSMVALSREYAGNVKARRG